MRAQAVQQLTMDLKVHSPSCGGGEIFCIHTDWLWGPPSLLHNGYRVISKGKVAGVWCWHPTLIWHRGYRQNRDVPLLPLCAFMAGYKINFTFYFTEELATHWH